KISTCNFARASVRGHQKSTVFARIDHVAQPSRSKCRVIFRYRGFDALAFGGFGFLLLLAFGRFGGEAGFLLDTRLLLLLRNPGLQGLGFRRAGNQGVGAKVAAWVANHRLAAGVLNETVLPAIAGTAGTHGGIDRKAVTGR